MAQEGTRIIDPVILDLAVALGIGLLIGAERERRKGAGPLRAPAGIRTFTVTSLAGAIAFIAGGAILLAVATAGVALLAAAAYRRGRSDDPGLTTNVALIIVALLGGLAIQQPALAAGAGVTIAVLLAARSTLHRFVTAVLTENELNEVLILGGATFVVLPLLPNMPMGPYSAINPRAIWIVVILVMAVGAAGYIAVRALGSRFGLPVAGLASGFVSSTATIGAMGARVAHSSTALPAAAAAAVLSTVATVVEMAVVVSAISLPTLQALTVPLLAAGLAAAAYGALFTVRILSPVPDDERQDGKAFSLAAALLFALILSTILIASAALKQWFGESGITLAAALAGFVDTHSAAISVAALVASGKMSSHEAILPILAGLSTNTISKIFVAVAVGGRAFALRVVPGLIVVALAAWVGALASLLSG